MRAFNMTYLIAILFLAPALHAEVADTVRVTVKGAVFDTARDAAKDLREATALAKKTGKNVLVEVGGNWCPWCRKLNMLFDENKDIKELLSSNYVLVHVNWSKENKNEAVLSRFPKVNGYPHLFVLDAKGDVLVSQETGALEEGDHHDPAKVMAFLDKWKPTSSKQKGRGI